MLVGPSVLLQLKQDRLPQTLDTGDLETAHRVTVKVNEQSLTMLA